MERVEHAAVDEKKFKPYSTLAKEPSDIRLQGPPVKKPAATHAKQMWENTAATPPKTKFEKGIIELGIEQSLQIQCETDDKLRVLIVLIMHHTVTFPLLLIFIIFCFVFRVLSYSYQV